MKKYLLASALLAVLFGSAHGFGQILIDDGVNPGAADSSGSVSRLPSDSSSDSANDSQNDFDDSPSDSVRTGKAAARSYFVAREAHEKEVRDGGGDRGPDSVSESSGDRYLMLGFGTFLNDKEWSWGAAHQDNVGSMMFDVTYRINEFANSFDLWFRAQYLTYNLTGGSAGQLAMMPIIAFPNARSGFPMYFGGGLGPGIFLKQINSSGDLGLNYVVLAGARFPNLFGSGGLYMEVGYQGLVNLLSVGQQQGVYLSAGGVFLF